MNTANYASYEASSFCVDASNLNFNEEGLITICDFPAFVHEWWHYIQDITTISGQNGFYLWMRDIVRMTSVTCTGNGNTITLPMKRDQYDECYSKYRKLYNIFCGEKIERRIENPLITEEPQISPNGICFDGEEHTFAKCEVKVCNEVFYFGLLVLQELNAFYAQKIVESYVERGKFNVPADSLPEFPYKMGDILFDYYHINCDIKTKFIISYLALDTIQSPTVFLYLLKALSGKNLNYTNNRDEILSELHKVSSTYSHPNIDAIDEWSKDYSKWANDQGHVMMRESLQWYINTIIAVEKLKKKYGEDTFAIALSKGHEFLKKLYECFPAPLIKQGNEVKGQQIKSNEELNIAARHDFEQAIVIWSHRCIYDLLKSQKREEFVNNSICPLYNDGNCLYLNKYTSAKQYDCRTAPWMVVKGEKQALCPYAVAAHSMGLWQNDLDIHF